MKNTLKLRQALLINNEQRNELSYDFDEITCDGFSSAFAYASAKKLTAAQANGGAIVSTMEFDGNIHFYMGVASILAVNPDIDITDLERIKGFDLVAITAIGRNFILGRSEEHLNPSNSDEPSETTQESTKPESKK